MCPSGGRVRSLCVDVEPGLVAAKLTLLGMRGGFWSRCVLGVIFFDPPMRKSPRIRVRRLTCIGRNVMGGRATMRPSRRRCSWRTEGVSPTRRWVRRVGVYIEPSFVAVTR